MLSAPLGVETFIVSTPLDFAVSLALVSARAFSVSLCSLAISFRASLMLISPLFARSMIACIVLMSASKVPERETFPPVGSGTRCNGRATEKRNDFASRLEHRALHVPISEHFVLQYHT